MRSVDDDALRLYDIVRFGKEILDFTTGGKQEFLEDRKTQAAVARNFEVIGEAIKRLSPELRAKHPNVDFSGAARFRDRLIHGYEFVDLDLVWAAVERTLPRLLHDVERIAALQAKKRPQ